MQSPLGPYLRAVKIVELVVAVRDKPSIRYGVIKCELRKGAHVLSLEEVTMNKDVWIRINLGWFCTNSIDDYVCIESVDIDQAKEAWRQEESKRQRFASAVVSSIIKFYPLPKAKRFIKSLCKHADKYYPSRPMVNIERKGLEDIMLSLGGEHPKSKEEIFSILKIAAAEQSDPQQAVLLIVNEIERVVNTRPSTWVVDQMNVLLTEDVVMRNDKFVMSAASGNVELLESYLDQGQ